MQEATWFSWEKADLERRHLLEEYQRQVERRALALRGPRPIGSDSPKGGISREGGWRERGGLFDVKRWVEAWGRRYHPRVWRGRGRRKERGS